MAGNPLAKQIAWDTNPTYLAAWKQGRTGALGVLTGLVVSHVVSFDRHEPQHDVPLLLIVVALAVATGSLAHP
jgi:hypothetical protein